MKKRIQKVLTIGPDFRSIHGGVVAVMSTYAEYIKDFKFMPTYSSENNLLNLLIYPVLLLKILIFLLLNADYKIIHIHGSSKISTYRKYVVFLAVKYIMRRKVIYHIHGSEYHLFFNSSKGIKKKIIKHFVEGSDGIICLSKQWKDFFVSNFNIKQIFILNNIVPYPDIGRKDIHEDFNLLFLGGFWERKGVFNLIEALGKCDKIILQKVKLRIGGEGDLDRLNNMLSQYNLQNNIEFLGWVTGDEKKSLLNNCDLFVLPSYNEGLPISILEAMSYKLPILTTDVGGIPEVVEDHKNGIITKPGDIEGIRKAIEFFVTHSDECVKYGEESFTRVKEFLPDRVMNDLEKIYQKVGN
jgi:glycosyltransferase involved in cell wall biosynthesis